MSKNSGKVKKEIPFKAQPCNKGGHCNTTVCLAQAQTNNKYCWW